MPTLYKVLVAVGLSLSVVFPARTAGEYPLTMNVDAQVKRGATTVTSKLTIHVDRLMEEGNRTRVTDALKYSGYANFLNALRPLAPVGTVQLEDRSVNLRYAREQQDEKGRRLTLVADRPLFFLGGNPKKTREGYELTIVDVHLDAQGGVSGTMTGAARVKPTADGGVVLDDFAEAPVQLTGRVSRP